ncbi:MAG TPA: energy transducer TonB [Pyrinomonadaceae bacterium]|nr:energy transducer TonB [Pyrinomonadaceae bacterium]
MTRLLILLACLFSLSSLVYSQTVEQPNFADVLQGRIQRARALIAAHQLETAASELESVRASTKDFSVQNIASVMLMNIYLESGNYGRAEALLEEGFRERATRNGDSARTYFALAGQAVNGSRLHIARYRSVGISTTDVNLPAEAITDLDRLRSFLERLIAQAKEITREQRAYDSLSLLEDVLGIRLSLAKDAEDQSRWQAEHSSARLLLTSPTQLVSLNGISALPPNKATKKDPSSLPYATRRVDDAKVTTDTAAGSSAPIANDEGEPQAPVQDAAQEAISPSGPLNGRATRKVVPAYPPLAKQAGAAGLVRVHVIVDESGKVIAVSKTEGHVLLRRVAEDAARQWFFDTNSSDNRPSRLSGYIDFNFTL